MEGRVGPRRRRGRGEREKESEGRVGEGEEQTVSISSQLIPNYYSGLQLFTEAGVKVQVLPLPKTQ